MSLFDPVVILIQPQMGENIGAAARAMLNFGLSELRLVAPRDGWPNERAVAMASRADSILDNAKVFDTTEAAIADLHHVYATTARQRDMIKPVTTPKVAAAEIRERSAKEQLTGLMFGKENRGLDREDVSRADTILTVPLNPDFSSINLGQAVLLVAYEWFQTDVPAQATYLQNEERPPTKEEFAHLFKRIESELDAREYFDRFPQRKKILIRNMRDMFQRANLIETDIKAFQGMIKGMSQPKKEQK